MSSQNRRSRSCSIAGTSDWLINGLIRGCVAGAGTVILVVAIIGAVEVLRQPEPLPAGTTTLSTQTGFQSFAALIYLCVILLIITTPGTTVGGVTGLATGAVVALVDVATRRRLSPQVLAVSATSLLAAAAQVLRLALDPRWDGQWAWADRCLTYMVTVPFLIAFVGLLAGRLDRPERTGAPV